MKTFDEYYNFTLLSTTELLNLHKKNIPKKNRFIAELGIKIFSYQSAATAQEQQDFKSRVKHDYEEYDSIEDIIKNENIYDKSDRNIINKSIEESSSQCSIDNMDSMKRLKKLLAETKFAKLPTNYDGLSDKKMEATLCIGPSLEKQYKKIDIALRSTAANNLKSELGLRDKEVAKLQKMAFNQILHMVNGENVTKISSDRLKTLEFLERCINQYFPSFIKDLGLNTKTQKLIDFRRNSTKKYNSACHKCGQPILRRNNNCYCTKDEDRKCYEERRKKMKAKPFGECLSRTKNKCENCGQRSSLDFIYKIERAQRQFCSRKCYETFRKRIQRKRKR